MTKFNIEFMIKGEDLSLEQETRLKDICKNLESRHKEFNLTHICYTCDLTKETIEEVMKNR